MEKYRPKCLDDMISHGDILSTSKCVLLQKIILNNATILVKRFIDEDRLPHLLFYGPPGTGKTSTILACAKMLYPPKEVNSMILEVMSICIVVLS